jgi:glycosyltransferase involved in cell wall biosynthesis
LPVIASRMGGIPEVVRDGETGLLLQRKDDAAELAAKITGLLRDQQLRKRLGQQGREWVENNFSWERSADDLEQLYDEVRTR